ncbi:MAG: CCA tRNA nucleotidyltransferase [Rhodomicrobium sp.]|nr:CCA tRNA nucleotidyltransferase [Rhodomicrobium sp.]
MEALSVATADWFLKPETQAVFACLNREGFETRAVGGAVRIALLGWGTVNEVDFATPAKPEDVIRLAGEAGIKALPTGIAHGTVTLITNSVPFEVTTLRQDVATDGRRATVAFGMDWEADARRRDFTMNALYADAKGEVYDPLGTGLSDLRAGRVRFIGSAEERIREDYLRILRFFRFSAGYAEGEFDREGIAAAIRERIGLLRLSRERVRTELLRILVARRARDAVEIMDEIGILLLLLGGVARRTRFERLCQIEAALKLVPDPIFRLASLGLFVEEDAGRLAERLRLSCAEARDLEGLSAIHPHISAAVSKTGLEVLLYRLGTRLYLGRLLLAWAASDATPDDAAWHFAAHLAGSWQRPVFPVSGADLIGMGWQPGPALGAVLKGSEEEWAAAGFTISREELLDRARKTRRCD